MKVVTLRGTYEITLDSMKVRIADQERELRRVPTPVIGERMTLETESGLESTEPVTEVQP